ncbi:MAG: hypothetical protein NZO16_01840 [Deltaproteobacteria bacterium]|nr:hypothetical protein [Deltaproteobacteria bacterium]
MQSKSLLIIDLMSLIFRSYYGTPKLNAPDGLPTNSVYTATRIILQLNDKFEKPYFLVTADSGKETFRTGIFEDYKANRPEAPDDLKIQIPVCLDVLKSLEINPLIVEGLEADDLISEAVFSLKSRFEKLILVTQDKDLAQLVDDDKVLRYDPFKSSLWSGEDVERVFGVSPKQLPIMFAIQGDSSDNVRGVPGFGSKNALKVARSFNSTDEFVIALNSGSSEIPKKILDFKEIVLRNLSLVELRPLHAVSLDNLMMFAKALKITPEFLSLCERLGFNSLIKKYGREGSVSSA